MLRSFTLAVLLLISLLWAMTAVAATGNARAPVKDASKTAVQLGPADTTAVTPTGFITVTTVDDEINSDGDCSLREAIQAADTDAAVDGCSPGSGGDTVVLHAGHYLLESDQLTLTGVITLQGSSVGSTILDGMGTHRVLYIQDNATAMLQSLDIRNGLTPYYEGPPTEILAGDLGEGGGLINYGTTTIARSAIHDNAGTPKIIFDIAGPGGGDGGDGGGIYNSGVLKISNSTISNNAAGSAAFGTTHGGEGGHCGPGGLGGGIANVGQLTLDNTTITNNEPGHPSCGDVNPDMLTGGGLSNAGNSSIIIKNSIVAGNVGSDCSGQITALGNNVIQKTTSCTVSGNFVEWPPQLGPLQDNGGPTPTYALTKNSPAVNTGDCTDSTGVTVIMDQRGVPRPQGGGCDIGAYESALTATFTIHHTLLPSVAFHTPPCPPIATPCKLTNSSLRDFAPVWSPDGQKIAFTRNDDGTNAIFVMNADGSEQFRVADRGIRAKWSPDSSKLAFAGDREGNFEIYVIDADGSHQTRLTNSVGIDNFEPAWSPDGSKILYTGSEPDCCGNFDAAVYMMNADGSQSRLLATHAGLGLVPWSPDGTKILYADVYPGGHGGFHIMDSNGANLLDLYDDDVAYFTWSPDSKRLAYVCRIYPSSSYDICVMNSDGSQRINLTNDDANDAGGGPVWSPDGNKLLFWRVYDLKNFMFELAVMNSDGSGLMRLIDPPTAVESGDAVWSPDDRKIAFVSSVSGNSEIYVIGIGE